MASQQSIEAINVLNKVQLNHSKGSLTLKVKP